MSDYGDDYSDDGGEWYYVEEEYMVADDLAEHAVASPPPTTYGDEDRQPDWDRFDYFNDLEYASDGYDDATFQVHNVKDAKTGQKRKREVKQMHSRKRRVAEGDDGQTQTMGVEHCPVVWRAQTDREIKARSLEDDAPSYALLKNWREELADTPQWARASSRRSQTTSSGTPKEGGSASRTEPLLPPSGIEDDISEETPDGDMEMEDMDLDKDAIMAALQRQLAAAGGPLSGMDPQQLLDFALRMAANKDAGDDIAGEMAEAMLEGDDEDDDADAEENLLSWVAQQRNANTDTSETAAESPAPKGSKGNGDQPPTPPPSEANRSIHVSETTTATMTANAPTKRKADAIVDADTPLKTVKKRVTKSFHAPTAASQARATRSSRAKRA